MSSNTIDVVRQQNQLAGAAQKDVGLAELDGFQLPSDVTEEFLERVQKSNDLLGRSDTMTLERLEQEVPQFGVPMLSGSTRDEEGSRTSSSDAESGHVKFNATDKSYYILVEPLRDALKNTHYGPEQFGDYIVDQFVERWANDAALIGMRAGASSGNLQSIGGAAALDSTWDGWIARAEGDSQSVDDAGDSTRLGLEDTATADAGSMPEVDNTDGSGNAQAIDTSVFNRSIQTLDSRYRDTDSTVFLLNPDHVQQYAMDLTEREDPLGSAVIFGDSDLTPFSYDIVGVNGWPTEYGMFIDPDNLAYGLFEGMELDQTTDTDKVHEDRLHSRNWLEGQMDFQIKEMQAGTLITGLADPLSA
ncbi:P2 family phage major capsid protein [Natrialba aegyptia]|uniref:Major capsid protein n=1 Tax=Natrialba aegyptia DSM 13077 TaxID=1227491 RepID=M0B454_9EURY|nr:P2 family phage major capsid protein [Natrialba aegyptia]ELZ05585.1 hypothetical protein C480_10405 [Natrialba aegyptia DSM 13077]